MTIPSIRLQTLRNNLAMYARRTLPKSLQLSIILYLLKRRRKKLNNKLAVKKAQQKNSINQYEKSIFSQNGEDGIIEYIFDQIGTTSKTFIEIGIGDGTENNTTYLLSNQWRGVLIDRSSEYIELAKYFYGKMLGPNSKNIMLIHQSAQIDSIDNYIAENSSSEVDLLSIDIDGNDYWIWQAINSVKPRVVVIEYNAQMGDTRSISTVYDPDFYCGNKHPSNLYHGASLCALTKLAENKGYRLVGCDSSGTNAFFVLNKENSNRLPTVSPQYAYFPNFGFSTKLSMEEQFRLIKHLPFENI